jgi:hypothetical protein
MLGAPEMVAEFQRQQRLLAPAPDTQFWRNASGRLTFDMFRVPADDYRAVRDALIEAFSLAPNSAKVTNGWDIAFQDFRRGEQVVGLEWDNWTGFTVVAKTPDAEPLVKEMAAWLLQSPWAPSPRGSHL